MPQRRTSRAQVIPGLVNSQPRAGLPFEWAGAVVNAGNVDIPYLTVAVVLDHAFTIILAPPPEAVVASTNSTENPAGGCDFLVRDLSPGRSVNLSFVVLGIGATPFYYSVVPILQSKQDFLAQVANEAEDLRDYILTITNTLYLTATNTSGVVTTNYTTFPPEVVAAMADTNSWANFYALALAAAGVLDTNDLESLPEPGATMLQQTTFSKAARQAAAQQLTSTCDWCSTVENNAGKRG